MSLSDLSESQLTHYAPYSMNEALVVLRVVHYKGMQLDHIAVYGLLSGWHIAPCEKMYTY